MWCDNCLLFFPLRAGAIVLAVIMALYEIAGGVFLFYYGEGGIFGGYAMLQGLFAIIAAIAFSSRSYLFSKFLVRLYPVIVFFGLLRAAIAAWELQHWEYRIIGECEYGGRRWVSENVTSVDPTTGAATTVATYDYTTNTTLPTTICNFGVHNFTELFTACLVIDFILMLYFAFLIWRFVVKLRHYPLQKGTGAAMFEQGFYA
ncbi:10706_t:CDS:2 [Ambispora leptoticha]|uniref:10706_t:CDS:1 n=1 Tax=Ambispora leptoticha TaxID=144679 RepID=A0A9N9H869_9GLOM|nr:10706_t:CDS:2 [Ambispora leptoticha]